MNKIVAYKPWIWTILAGISYVFCFPQYDIPYLSLLFMPCLLFALHHIKSKKEAWMLGFLLSFMVAWGGFHWIIYVSQNFGDMPLPFAILLLLLYSLVAAPQMVAFYVIGFQSRYIIEPQPLWFRPLYWSCFYVALEYIFHFFKIFPEHLGNTLIAFLPLAQSASFGGVAILSFFPLFLGASFYYLYKEGRAAILSCVISLLIIVAAWLWGKNEIKKYEQINKETLKVGIWQHNLPEMDKLIPQIGGKNAFDYTIQTLVKGYEELSLQKPDLIIWPETSYPLVLANSLSEELNSSSFGYANLIRSAVKKNKIPLLLGGYESQHGVDYNSAILLNEKGENSSSYRKVYLLLGGEYLPFSDTFPSLKDLNPQMGDFGRGPGAIPLTFPAKGTDFQLGVNICYEAIIPEYMRNLALNGANLFVNLTKDSWFGNTFEPWQHFQLSVIRSIENRIPMIRATNSGLSGVIFPTGKYELISAPFEAKAKVVTIPIIQSKKPFYTLFGPRFSWLCIIISFIPLLGLMKKLRKIA